MPDDFKKFQVDGGGKAAIPLTIADQLLVKPVGEASIVGLYLATKPQEDTGDRVETQWALTVDQAEWLARNLMSAVRDVRRKSR